MKFYKIVNIEQIFRDDVEGLGAPEEVKEYAIPADVNITNVFGVTAHTVYFQQLPEPLGDTVVVFEQIYSAEGECGCNLYLKHCGVSMSWGFGARKNVTLDFIKGATLAIEECRRRL